VFREVRLTAAPALGAIPLAFIRNQFQYCSLICTFAVQGAITVPIGAAAAPATFLGSLASTGNIFKAFGSAAASVTGPADAAVTPLINNDVFLVVPKAFHALDVAVLLQRRNESEVDPEDLVRLRRCRDALVHEFAVDLPSPGLAVLGGEPRAARPHERDRRKRAMGAPRAAAPRGTSARGLRP